MPTRKQSRQKLAQIIEYEQLKTAAGGSGASGGGSRGDRLSSLMRQLLLQRQAQPKTLAEDSKVPSSSE